MTQEKKPNIERWQIKVLDVKERQPIGTSGAIKLAFQGETKEHTYWFFTFSKRLTPIIESSVGKVIDAQVEISTRETESATYIDRKVTELFVDGKSVQDTQKQGGWRGKSPEELELSRRSYALSYAKDLAVADRIKVNEIIGQAQKFNDWLSGVKSPAVKKTTKPKEEQASTPDEGPSEPEVTNLGQLFQACKDQFKMTMNDVLAELNVSSKDEIADAAEAWSEIKSVRS